jgi:Holliday junction resolvase RusA-like endonuclease
MKVSFTVLGEPQGKGRPRFSTIAGHVQARTPKETVLYENLIRTEYQRQLSNTRFPDDEMLTMCVKAYYSIPASASNKKRMDMLAGGIRPTKKPDVDNILKVVADSLNQIAYRDDAQIVTAIIMKDYAAQPRLEVVIQTEKLKLEG